MIKETCGKFFGPIIMPEIKSCIPLRAVCMRDKNHKDECSMDPDPHLKLVVNNG